MPTNGQWLEALFRTNRESLYLSNLFQLTIFSLNFGNDEVIFYTLFSAFLFFVGKLGDYDKSLRTLYQYL